MIKILNLISLIKTYFKDAYKSVCFVSVALLLLWSINTCNNNKKLSYELENAKNNIEAYLGLLDDSLLANNVLRLNIKELLNLNDNSLHKLDSVRLKLKIKPQSISTAATQKLILNVIDSKGVGGDIISILKDTTYTDSIKYNDLTTVYYTISPDTISIGLNIENEQYLYIFNKKEYKNKKSFIKRLFTFDFKKINKYKYEIYNTNDLIKNDNVRIVEITK